MSKIDPSASRPAASASPIAAFLSDLLGRMLRALARSAKRSADRRYLQSMPDYMLRDIGVTRIRSGGEAEYEGFALERRRFDPDEAILMEMDLQQLADLAIGPKPRSLDERAARA